MERHDGFGGEKFIRFSPMLSFSPHTKPVKHDAPLAPGIPKQTLYLTSEHSSLRLHRRSYRSRRLQLRVGIVHLNHEWGLVQHTNTKYKHVVFENTFGEHLVCSVFGHSFTSEMDSGGADVITPRI